MSLQSKLFRHAYKYKRKFINACIMRIRFGKRPPRAIQAYKTYIFKSMKDIVAKNIHNYLNLLNNGTSCRDIPEYDELVSECYLVFETCVSKFVVNKRNNFYFYFNKSLSRKFYRLYQKELNMTNVELSDDVRAYHPKLHDNGTPDYIETLMDSMGFSRVEKAVCRSKMKGEKISDFLKSHKTCNERKYNNALKHIKQVMAQLQETGQL